MGDNKPVCVGTVFKHVKKGQTVCETALLRSKRDSFSSYVQLFTFALAHAFSSTNHQDLTLSLATLFFFSFFLFHHFSLHFDSPSFFFFNRPDHRYSYHLHISHSQYQDYHRQRVSSVSRPANQRLSTRWNLEAGAPRD